MLTGILKAYISHTFSYIFNNYEDIKSYFGMLTGILKACISHTK